MEQVSPREKALAFQAIFGSSEKIRSREQGIVWQELVTQFELRPPFMLIQGVGVDTHLAAINSGKIEIAQLIRDLTTINPMELMASESPEVTKQQEKDKVNEEL